MMSKIDDRTYISIPLLISLIGSIIGGIVWLTSIYNVATSALAKADSTAAYYQQINDGQSALYKSLSETNQRLANIEGKLDLLVTKNRQ